MITSLQFPPARILRLRFVRAIGAALRRDGSTRARNRGLKPLLQKNPWRTISVKTLSGMAFAVAFVMNLTTYWFSDRIVLAMYRAQEVSEAQAFFIVSRISNYWHQSSLVSARLLSH